MWAVAALLAAAAVPVLGQAPLPEAPGALLADATAPQNPSSSPAETPQQAHDQRASRSLPPCPKMSWDWRESTPASRAAEPCAEDDPLQRIVSTSQVKPLSSEQKGVLAFRDIVDPFNLLTIAGYSGIYVAADAHSPYGPGFRGFGRLAGYSLVEDAQGEFFGTYVIPSLAQEDPRYHRDPEKPIRVRLLHAVAHTVLSQHDDGTLMPNYATLLTYPISAELSNLYVPGVAVNAPSTAKRVALGLATNPVGDIVAEFLPDVARRIHIRVVFVQQILNQVVSGAPNVQ